jgi:hypothetical protein
MKKAARTSTRWYAAWRARPVAAPEVDPADFGTAFGLDLSIPGDVTPARAVPAAPQGWRARWSQRRRAA